MDEYLRRLERLAASGDSEAIKKLRHWHDKFQPRFFCYWQNNVTGLWVNRPSEGVGRHVVMEAFSVEEAEDRLQQLLGNNYFDHCDCCGRRWGNPEVFLSLNSILPRTSKENCYVHFLDGTIAPC